MTKSKHFKIRESKARGGSGGDRIDRINDLIHRSIAKILMEEFKDPRIGMVTIANVEVSRDLAHAKVFVTVYQEEKIKETIDILNGAAGFFRAELRHHIHLRVLPRLRFIFDDSVLRGTRISALLAKENEVTIEPELKPESQNELQHHLKSDLKNKFTGDEDID